LIDTFHVSCTSLIEVHGHVLHEIICNIWFLLQ
jgi:hypothetical protein